MGGVITTAWRRPQNLELFFKNANQILTLTAIRYLYALLTFAQFRSGHVTSPCNLQPVRTLPCHLANETLPLYVTSTSVSVFV